MSKRDLHGYSTAFDASIAAVNPKLEALIVTLGDYVDRGPDSKGIIDRPIALHATGQPILKIIPLSGLFCMVVAASNVFALHSC